MFQKEIFSTFEEFILNLKIYLRDSNMFDVCEKGTIFFNLLIVFPSVLRCVICPKVGKKSIIH
jgi:hypothetical protein